MRKVISFVCLAFLFSCAAPSTITMDSKGNILSMQNMSLATANAVITPKIADNWFTGVMKDVMDSIGPYMAIFKGFLTSQPAAVVTNPVQNPPAPSPPVIRPYP